ncbi:MAG: immunoglobulin-like domain-containing protein [Alkalibacterium sp.]
MKYKTKAARGLVLAASVGVLSACSEIGSEPSPYEEVNTLEDVRLELEKDSYDPEGDTFMLNTINESDSDISYGIAFSLEKIQDGEWYIVEPDEDMVFIMIAHSLSPGEVAQDELNMEYFEPLESGEYRVVREIEGEVLTAEFEVE